MRLINDEIYRACFFKDVLPDINFWSFFFQRNSLLWTLLWIHYCRCYIKNFHIIFVTHEVFITCWRKFVFLSFLRRLAAFPYHLQFIWQEVTFIWCDEDKGGFRHKWRSKLLFHLIDKSIIKERHSSGSSEINAHVQCFWWHI